MAITNYICRYCLILVASIIPEGITSFVHKYQFISKERLTSTTTIFAGSIPTWTIIESSFGETLSTSGVICIDSVLEPKKNKNFQQNFQHYSVKDTDGVHIVNECG